MTYVLVFIAGFIGISLLSFYLVTHPQQFSWDRTPAEYALPVTDVTVTAADGTELAGWLIAPPEATERIVIMLHGYPADRSDVLPLAAELYPDSTLLLVDQRSFGASEGTFTLGIKERDDVRAMVDFVEARGYERVGLFGFSFGGAVALMAAAEDERIDAVAAYSSYSDLRRLGWDAYRHLWVLKYPLVELMNLYAKLTFGTFASDVSPIHAAETLNTPTFIIHTRNDSVIPFEHAERLERALQRNDRAQFYFPVGGEHEYPPADLGERLKQFFASEL